MPQRRRMSRLAIDLPHDARVRFSVLDLQGRRVWRQRGRDVTAGHHELDWPGLNSAGLPAPVGYYRAVVRVDALVYRKPFALVR